MELSGEGQLGVRDRVCTRGQWAWNRRPRAVGTAPSARVLGASGQRSQTQGLIFGATVWSLRLNLIIPPCPFQLSISYPIW